MIRPEQAPMPELDVQYHIPFKWGDLTVSKAAHETYGLIPLTADAIEGPAPNIQESQRLPVRLLMVVPGESGVEKLGQGTLTGITDVNKKGINIVLAAGYSQEEVKKSTKGAKVRIMADDAVLEELSLEEMAEQAVPQALAHGFVEAVQYSAFDPLQAWGEFASAQRQLRIIKGMGATGVIGAGIAIGAHGAFSLFQGNVDTTNILPGLTAGITSGLYFAYTRGVRDYLLDTTRRRIKIEEDARAQANEIAGDFHRVFCSQHFNQEAEERLNLG